MKLKTLTLGLIAFSVSMSPSFAFFGGGSVSGAKEWTQISNKVLLGKQLTEQARMYKKQIDEFRTQVEQFDLEQIMAEKFDTSVFDDTLDELNSYKASFDTVASGGFIQNDLKRFEQLKSAAQTQNAENFLNYLGEMTNQKKEIFEKQSRLTENKMVSIEADKQSLSRLQSANQNATGHMQAAQVGNHINTEIVAQIIKMRQEQATQAQIDNEQRAIDNEKEAAKAAMLLKSFETNQARRQERRSAPKAKIDNLNLGNGLIK